MTNENATDAVTWIESLNERTDPEDADAAIRNAAAVAARLDEQAQDLHRKIDEAIDHDMAAVAPLTRELRRVYFERDRIRTALSAARASWPQLFDQM